MSPDKIAAFTEILRQNPDAAFARYGLAMEYRQHGQTALAMAQFDELEKRHPDYTAGYQMASQILVAEDKIEAARERLRAGIAAARRSGKQHASAEMQAMLDDLEHEGR